ncbi:MAG: SprT-like domain-containing protein [Acidiferrobacterales bacterium]|nr:SprT-like domain-containing protein [Acidiferrobacterales bacterium]
MSQFTHQIQPIGKEQQTEVIKLAEHFICQAEKLFQISLEKIPVTFDLKGRAAGMFRIKKGEKQLRFNPWIFSLHYDANLYDTVPHEVAHYVVNVLFGSSGIKPHGPEWQNVMIALGREPKTTCDFPIDGVPTRQMRHFAYQCYCQDHKVSSIRHNRIQRGQTYYCRRCRSQLKAIARSSISAPLKK